MALRYSKQAEAALQAAHTAFSSDDRPATWDRLVQTLTRLENDPRLFSALEGTPFEPAKAATRADVEYFATILDADPPGPAVSITWSLDTDGGVSVHLINW